MVLWMFTLQHGIFTTRPLNWWHRLPRARSPAKHCVLNSAEISVPVQMPIFFLIPHRSATTTPPSFLLAFCFTMRCGYGVSFSMWWSRFKSLLNRSNHDIPTSRGVSWWRRHTPYMYTTLVLHTYCQWHHFNLVHLYVTTSWNSS